MPKCRKPIVGSIIYAYYEAGSKEKHGVFFVHNYTRRSGLDCYIILTRPTNIGRQDGYYKFECGSFVMFKQSFHVLNANVEKILCWIEDQELITKIVTGGARYKKKYAGIWDRAEHELSPLPLRGFVSGGKGSSG